MRLAQQRKERTRSSRYSTNTSHPHFPFFIKSVSRFDIADWLTITVDESTEGAINFSWTQYALRSRSENKVD